MYYQPLLPNGKPVPLSWPIRAFRRLNGISWPLEDNPSVWARFLDRFYYIVGFLIFVQHHDAETRYLRIHFHEIDLLLIGIPTYTVLAEMHLRAFQLGATKEGFKKVLRRFYAKVYIEESHQPEVFKDIKRKLRLTHFNTSLYYIALSFFLIVPILNWINSTRDTLYKMAFSFDYTPYYFYYPIMFGSIWVGLIVTTGLTGEATLISEIILHLNGRLHNLNDELQKVSENILITVEEVHMAHEMQKRLRAVLSKHRDLYEFIDEFQKEFSFRIFVWVGCSATLICGLSFKVYTNPKESVGYAVWIFAKLLEMLAIGEMGSMLYKTTYRISGIYYDCNWEEVVAASSNTRENVRLMKLVLLAIEMFIKPIQIHGLHFFSLSLDTIEKVLKAAFSYFTCLTSIR